MLSTVQMSSNVGTAVSADKTRVVQRWSSGSLNEHSPVALGMAFLEPLVHLKNVMPVIIGHDVSTSRAHLGKKMFAVVIAVLWPADFAASCDVVFTEPGDDVHLVIAGVCSLARVSRLLKKDEN